LEGDPDMIMEIRYGRCPFKYDNMGGFIIDSDGNKILSLQGWGYLTGKGAGALGLTDESAVKLMDAFARWVVLRLNAEK
jgi:hypothetical protein